MRLTKRTKERIAASVACDDHILQVWLFGSYARGDADSGSDVDLLIVHDREAVGCLVERIDMGDVMDLVESLPEEELGLAVMPRATKESLKDILRWRFEEHMVPAAWRVRRQFQSPGIIETGRH